MTQPRSDTDAAARAAMLCAAAMIAQQVGAKATRDAMFLSSFGVEALPAMLVVSAVFWLSRSGRLEPQRLLDVGLAYEIVVAFGISMGDNLTPLTSDRPLEAYSPLCLWIVMFPLIVRATWGKTLLASLLAASTWPPAFFLGLVLGQQASESRAAG